MKYLSRDALAARVNAAVAAAGADVAKATLGGFAVRSKAPVFDRSEITDADRERVRAVLGDDAAGARLLRYTLSTEKRQADSLALAMTGAKLDRYAKNPIILEGHRWYSRHPIGHSVVWTENASDTGPRLRGLAAMLSREMSQALDRGFSWALGELAALRGHAASIGFDVLLAHPAPPDVRQVDPWAMDVDEWELVEWSFVTIPMDADAVADGRAAGIDMGPLVDGFGRLMDELTGAGIARQAIETAWSTAAHSRGLVFAPAPAPTPPKAEPAPVADTEVSAAEVRAAIQATARQLLQG